MVNQGKNTSQFPLKTAPFDANDCFVIVYGYDTVNTVNSVAQTALINLTTLLQNPLNLPINGTYLVVNTTSTVGDPLHSNSTTVAAGTVWATNNFLYVATANNNVLRVALSSF